MHKQRINLNDSLIDVISKLAEGNPGAITVCMNVLKSAEKIDPASALSAFGPLLLLDSFGFYGPSIWMLFKDVCGENLINMLGVLRAVQLGFLSQEELGIAVNNRGRKSDGTQLDVAGLLAQVRERLPDFGVENESTNST